MVLLVVAQLVVVLMPWVKHLAFIKISNADFLFLLSELYNAFFYGKWLYNEILFYSIKHITFGADIFKF